MNDRRTPRPTLLLPATYDDALALQMRDYLRERLNGARWEESRKSATKLLLMAFAAASERNCAAVVDLATRGFLDAYEAVAELVSHRLASDQPLEASLKHFVYLGMPRPPAPEGRQSDWLGDYAIVLLIADLKSKFPGAHLYRSSSNSTSICAVVAEALRGPRNITESAVRQIYERRGPRAVPAYRRGPKPGCVRLFASE